MGLLKKVTGGIRTAVNASTGGLSAPLIGGSSSYKENLKNFYTGNWTPKKEDGSPYSQQEINQINTANLFQNLSPEQQKDLLLNNPNIVTPQGSQTYDPLTNTLTLGESDFTKAERLRQEALASQLSGSLSGDFSNSGEAIQNATFERGKAMIDPIISSQRKRLAQQLADQGIPMGSEQYNSEMNRFDDSVARQYTDLTQASIQTGEQVRQQRFNEIATLLGRSQVQTGSSFQQYQPNFSGLDLFGAEQAGINRQFQQSMLSQQLRQQNRNAQYQALGSLGSAAIEAGGRRAASDIRLKENIKQIGVSEKGLAIYQFEYKNKDLGEGIYEGVMAQDLLESNPEAVISDSSGILSVDYSKIDVEFRRVH